MMVVGLDRPFIQTGLTLPTSLGFESCLYKLPR